MSLPYLIRWGFFCEANLNWVIEAVHFQVEPCEEESGQYLVNISPQISECAVYQWSLKSGVIKPKWAVWAGLISGPTCHISGWLNSVSGILFEKNPQYRQTWTVHSQCCLHLLCFSLHLPWRLCQGQVCLPRFQMRQIWKCIQCTNALYWICGASFVHKWADLKDYSTNSKKFVFAHYKLCWYFFLIHLLDRGIIPQEQACTCSLHVIHWSSKLFS